MISLFSKLALDKFMTDTRNNERQYCAWLFNELLKVNRGEDAGWPENVEPV